MNPDETHDETEEFDTKLIPEDDPIFTEGVLFTRPITPTVFGTSGWYDEDGVLHQFHDVLDEQPVEDADPEPEPDGTDYND